MRNIFLEAVLNPNRQMVDQEAIHVTVPPSYAECKSASQVCVVYPISIPMNGEVVVVVVGHCGRGPSSYLSIQILSPGGPEILQYWDFVHQNYYLFIFPSKVSSSPVIQMKQSWHSECDMS